MESKHTYQAWFMCPHELPPHVQSEQWPRSYWMLVSLQESNLRAFLEIKSQNATSELEQERIRWGTEKFWSGVFLCKIIFIYIYVCVCVCVCVRVFFSFYGSTCPVIRWQYENGFIFNITLAGLGGNILWYILFLFNISFF